MFEMHDLVNYQAIANGWEVSKVMEISVQLCYS